ncbi:MAG: Si-specific NAD(P)(+) transhydrogenase [Gammaproteobacteria bacterium]|jgi:NAD(P) transhydrogenase|nr:Si-specific NAD(P)(+) transhydrogenase [Gammaproteobacteria bacterium]
MLEKYEVIVIGSGPGGEGAAMKAAKGGRRVAVIEEKPRVGGNCTHTSTIPSKALRQAVQQLVQTGRQDLARFDELLRSARAVIDRQVNMRTGFYHRNRVDVITGHARFVDDHIVEVSGSGQLRRYHADNFVIAPGSRPFHPPDIDFFHPRILDSDTVLGLTDSPRSITIYGAGVVGCEYASIFRNLGIKVNLINTRPQLLSFLDDEIVDALSYHFREQGILIRHDEEYERAEADDQCVTLHLKSQKLIRADYLLWAQGRAGNTDDLGLTAIGVETDARGLVRVDSCYRSSRAHIYAVGDITGSPNLASAAYDQGRYAATHLLQGGDAGGLLRSVPTGIYTLPEISSIGRTERELTAECVPYEVGHSLFRHLARAQISGQTTGMLKILFHRETLEILGIHCFGDQAAEIIHIGQVVMSQPGAGNTLRYFVDTTFNYPTMAEAYRVAALNGLNRVS